MIHKEFNFNHYNTKLYGQYFKPTNVKAVIVLIHGMGEHSKRYEKHVIPYFNQNLFAVITYDQFGHGRTEGKRGHNPGFQAVLDCLDIVLVRARNLFADKPVFLYGHSMGGNVVINYALRRGSDINGVIASSPFLRLAFTPPNWKLFLAKNLQRIAPSITLGNEIDPEAISRDRNEVEIYRNDPLIHDKVSPNYSIVFIETGEWAIRNADKLKIPMLLMHGTGDKLTSFKASEEFVKIANGKAELQLFENAYHELHNDTVKNELMENMVSWLNKILTRQ